MTTHRREGGGSGMWGGPSIGQNARGCFKCAGRNAREFSKSHWSDDDEGRDVTRHLGESGWDWEVGWAQYRPECSQLFKLRRTECSHFFKFALQRRRRRRRPRRDDASAGGGGQWQVGWAQDRPECSQLLNKCRAECPRIFKIALERQRRRRVP